MKTLEQKIIAFMAEHNINLFGQTLYDFVVSIDRDARAEMANRACEIVGAISEDTFHASIEARVAEAQNTIRKEARPQVEGQDAQSLSDETLKEWFELSKRDICLVGSEIRQLIGDLQRARRQLAASRRDYAEAITVLRRFAEIAEWIPASHNDAQPYAHVTQDRKAPGTFTSITVGLLRRARALIAAADAKGGEG